MTRELILVVTTLGRVAPLRTLLTSVAAQLEPSDELVIVAQDNLREVEALVAGYVSQSAGLLTVTTSERGASIGRNAGVAASTIKAADAIVMFPNDTSWFPEGAIAAIRRGLGGAPAGAVVVMTPSGPRFSLPPAESALDKSTVWSVIEMGLVIRLELFMRLGGFSPSIGTGAPTPWQAGEVTDLLLRALELTPRLTGDFEWIHDPSAIVGGIEEGSGLSADERAWKQRAYGRGVAHIYRIHRYPLVHRWAFVAAGLLIGLRRRGEYRLRDGLSAGLGRFEGTTGRIIGNRRSARAVVR